MAGTVILIPGISLVEEAVKELLGPFLVFKEGDDGGGRRRRRRRLRRRRLHRRRDRRHRRHGHGDHDGGRD